LCPTCFCCSVLSGKRTPERSSTPALSRSLAPMRNRFVRMNRRWDLRRRGAAAAWCPQKWRLRATQFVSQSYRGEMQDLWKWLGENPAYRAMACLQQARLYTVVHVPPQARLRRIKKKLMGNGPRRRHGPWAVGSSFLALPEQSGCMILEAPAHPDSPRPPVVRGPPMTVAIRWAACHGKVSRRGS